MGSEYPYTLINTIFTYQKQKINAVTGLIIAQYEWPCFMEEFQRRKKNPNHEFQRQYV